jgi:hypothetical protein
MHAVAAKFDLVAVRSAGVDRRSLSQAWYDALHLATSSSGTRREDVPLLNARLFPRGKVCSPTFPSRHPWLREKLERPSGNVPRVALPTKEVNELGERRARLTSLAGDIVARLRSQPKATRFVFETPQGRVCLYVVRGERHVQIAAFCPAALRDVVQRALAQVRYAL